MVWGSIPSGAGNRPPEDYSITLFNWSNPHQRMAFSGIIPTGKRCPTPWNCRGVEGGMNLSECHGHIDRLSYIHFTGSFVSGFMGAFSSSHWCRFDQEAGDEGSPSVRSWPILGTIQCHFPAGSWAWLVLVHPNPALLPLACPPGTDIDFCSSCLPIPIPAVYGRPWPCTCPHMCSPTPHMFHSGAVKIEPKAEPHG